MDLGHLEVPEDELLRDSWSDGRDRLQIVSEEVLLLLGERCEALVVEVGLPPSTHMRRPHHKKNRDQIWLQRGRVGELQGFLLLA